MLTMSKILNISNYFIYLSQKNNRSDLTNKKLQKLLYYSQAWNLVFRNKKLFKDNIEAWVHGPAIPIIYHEYKQYGSQPIDKEVKKEDFSSLSSQDKKILDEIWKIYGIFDAEYLEALTHSELPWQEARKRYEPFAASNKTISTDSMKKFYDSKRKKT